MTLRLLTQSFAAIDQNGSPISGAKLNIYEAGATTTRLKTFSDKALTVPNTNPVIAASNGIFPDLFTAAGDYRVIYTDADDVTIKDWDELTVVATTSFSGGLNNTVETEHLINAQTGTSYTTLDNDRAKVVTHNNAADVAGTLPKAAAATFENGWYYEAVSLGAELSTITPTTSTIGGRSLYRLPTNKSVKIVSDGTNYLALNRASGTPGILLSKKTASASSTIVFDEAINSAYKRYLVVIDGLQVSVATDLQLTVSTDTGSTYLTDYDVHAQKLDDAANTYDAQIATGASLISVTAGTNINTGNPKFHAEIEIHDPSGTQRHLVTGNCTYISDNDDTTGGDFYAVSDGTTAVDAIKFALNTGTMTVGTFRLYGI